MQGKKVSITKKELYKLYCVEKKSTIAIAKIYDCHPFTISSRLWEFNIPIRFKYEISKKDLLRQYHKENKSTIEIAKIYNCTAGTVSNRLNKFGIRRKSKCQARMRYPKYDFSGGLVEKAYLIGFRVGDLRVHKSKPDAETIIVQCHTTQDVQIVLIKNLFEKYGQVTISRFKDGTIGANCYLNETFNFLLSKKDDIAPWVYKNKKFFAAFTAGYIDAEGNFIINQGRARFKIDSYDKNILGKIHCWLNKNNIRSKYRRIGEKGGLRPEGYFFNKDLWRLNVNEAYGLLKFINLVKPFILHKKRLKDINLCLSNIMKRKQRGTI